MAAPLLSLSGNPTPTRLIVPSEVHGQVKRRLVLRNPLADQELIMKLVLNPRDDPAVHLGHKWILLRPRMAVQVDVTVDTTKLGGVGQQIRGYVRVRPQSKEEIDSWLKTNGVETRRQLAFTLAIRCSTQFSALDTVIDLPGHALLLEPKNAGIFGQDDKGIEEALPMDADTLTARPFGSLEDVARQLKAGQKTGNDDCWLLKKYLEPFIGGEKKEKKGERSRKSVKSKTSQRSQKKAPRSQYIQQDMNDRQPLNV